MDTKRLVIGKKRIYKIDDTANVVDEVVEYATIENISLTNNDDGTSTLDIESRNTGNWSYTQSTNQVKNYYNILINTYFNS